jgi:beta-lactamase regulating signal transducer with metallopeptidase domain
MNYIVSIIALIVLIATNPAYAEVTTKEVCRDKVDKAGQVVKDKSGKTTKVCKKVKVHKKVDGTRVPEKPPKK